MKLISKISLLFIFAIFLNGCDAQTMNTLFQPYGTTSSFNNAPTTMQKFGNGYILNTQGQLPTTMQKFGNGYIMNTPGQRSTIATPFGNGWIFN